MNRSFWIGLLLITLGAPDRAAADSGAATCPYATAHEAPLNATETPVEWDGAGRRLRVELNGIRGDRVPGFLYVPTDGPGPFPATMLQYGSGGHKGVNYIVELARQFVSAGFVVFTIDSPGKGDRQGEGVEILDWITTGKGREQFVQYCGDYSRAVDYLTSRADVDRERLAFVGLSWGAITGVTYAAHDPRVRGVCSILGGGGFLELSEAIRGSRQPSIDPVRNVGRIAPRPLLLLNARRDMAVLPPFARALHRAAGPRAKKVWLDTDHLLEGVDRAAVGESIILFLQTRLPGGPI